MFKLNDKTANWGIYSPVCSFCKHYQDNYKCAAFDEIPEAIWFGKNKHRRPYPGDNGIQFEPLERKP